MPPGQGNGWDLDKGLIPSIRAERPEPHSFIVTSLIVVAGVKAEALVKVSGELSVGGKSICTTQTWQLRPKEGQVGRAQSLAGVSQAPGCFGGSCASAQHLPGLRSVTFMSVLKHGKLQCAAIASGSRLSGGGCIHALHLSLADDGCRVVRVVWVEEGRHVGLRSTRKLERIHCSDADVGCESQGCKELLRHPPAGNSVSLVGAMMSSPTIQEAQHRHSFL